MVRENETTIVTGDLMAKARAGDGAYLLGANGISHGTGLYVLGLTGDRISAMTRFDNAMLPWFGLPRSLPSRYHPAAHGLACPVRKVVRGGSATACASRRQHDGGARGPHSPTGR